MSTPSRGIRLVWFLGFVLLLGTAVGAGWMLKQPASSGTTIAEPEILGIVGLGHVDVESGISFLHPIQPGRVENVWVKEGDQVKKGDKLISLEDTVHKANLNAAEAELAVAKSNLQDAEAQAKKKWELEIEKQKELIEGARQEMIVADNEVIIAKELFEAKPPQVNKEQFQMAQSKAEGRKAAVKALEFALEQLRLQNPQGIIDRAREDMKAKQALRDKAQQALVECDLVAPSDGIVLRIFASKGDVLNGQPAKAAVHFCPDLPRIIRVEILQEWANKLQEGQLADIEDDTRSGVQWKGKVERISKWFSPRRNPMQEPFQFNDVRTLECIVHLDPGGPPLRIGQRVRVIIRQGGP